MFPLPFVLVVLGYAFILLIDRVLIDSHQADGDIIKEAEDAIIEAAHSNDGDGNHKNGQVDILQDFGPRNSLR